MAVGWFRRFVGFVRIWTKIGLFCGPKAKWNTWNTRNTWNTWNTVCGCSDCFFVNISKNSVAKLMMAFIEGKTNRECSYFLGGLAIWRWLQTDGSSAIKAAECIIRMGCDVSLRFGAWSERNKKKRKPPPTEVWTEAKIIQVLSVSNNSSRII